MKLKINTDGGSRGNPGPSAIGVVIRDNDDEIVFAKGKYIGETTNNIAEYQALIWALEKAVEIGGTEIECLIDSELLVKQLKGEYKVKNEELAKKFIQIHNLQLKFKKIEYKHVYRENNKEADALVNKALDNR